MATPSRMSHAIRASLPMNRLPTLTQERLIPLPEEDLSSDILQDLLAIVHFPRQQNKVPDRHLIIEHHLNTWGQKGFMNPFITQDEVTVNCLVIIWLRVVDLVEDYLGKAVNEYPPRAYHNLPGSYLAGLDAHAFNIGDLTAPERTRIIQAFLRYELTSQVSRHWSPPKASSTESPDPFPKPRNWKTLCDAPKWNHWNDEELLSVHEYFCSLYGALFARESSAWLPCQPTTSVPRRRGSGLAFPDNVLFSPSAYAQDLGLWPTACGMSSILASYGMDLATNLMADAKPGTINGPWLRKLATLIRSADDNCRMQCHSSLWEGFLEENGRDLIAGDCEDVPIAHPAFAIEPKIGAWPVTGVDHGWHDILRGRLCQDQICCMVPETVYTQFAIYRQRAWVFFDDCRFYPKPVAKHFPTYREVQIMEKEAAEVTWR